MATKAKKKSNGRPRRNPEDPRPRKEWEHVNSPYRASEIEALDLYRATLVGHPSRVDVQRTGVLQLLRTAGHKV